ncbi:DNA-3-methyladenine glycosylase 2 family protein [Salinimonas chungwhensis]|uniref:DNA-3-methyladenine glycosylase 2 family protein n=1 Tax=Salinimonas chungwhensis TaxID=265425 RepID=UPI00036C883D|nr:Ada metal-binding domain-containing protein [Salinimonas chungwhensis]
MASAHPYHDAFRQARQSRDPRFDGLFYVAVTSTGIFCRPVCPARLPLEKNVRYYHFATQALQDGFRPCRRCRPDSAPESPAWRGVTTTVERARRLLTQLPVRPVYEVAAKLGVSERYLYQLTRTHLGISPKQLQIYSQLWFARQLLTQTSLRIIDVAAACGLHSARRLQDLMQKYWRVTPTMLKSQPPNHNGTAPVVLFLPCHAPYNWPQVRDFIAAHQLERVEKVFQNGYARAFNWQDSEGYLKAEFCEKRCGFEVSLNITDLQFIQPVMANLARMLDTNAHPETIHRALLAAGISKQKLTRGLRFPGTWDVFEAASRAVVGQQISLKAATGYINRMDQLIGGSNCFGPVFPSPQEVVAQPVDFLKMPASRQRTLATLAEAFTRHAQPPDTDTLLALKGIGPWTCDYIQLRGYNACDIYLHSDLIVRNVAKTEAVQPDLAAPWRSYLTLQLWQIALEQRARQAQEKKHNKSTAR